MAAVEMNIRYLKALPYRADLTRRHGFFHAGITSTIADSAGVFAVEDGRATLCARLLETLLCLEHRPDEPATGRDTMNHRDTEAQRTRRNHREDTKDTKIFAPVARNRINFWSFRVLRAFVSSW